MRRLCNFLNAPIASFRHLSPELSAGQAVKNFPGKLSNVRRGRFWEVDLSSPGRDGSACDSGRIAWPRRGRDCSLRPGPRIRYRAPRTHPLCCGCRRIRRRPGRRAVLDGRVTCRDWDRTDWAVAVLSMPRRFRPRLLRAKDRARSCASDRPGKGDVYRRLTRSRMVAGSSRRLTVS